MHALLSVTDRSGLVAFGRGLAQQGATLAATTGTAGKLADAGVEVATLADLSGMPELLGGRVKAFHPTIFGGLLYRRGHPQDEADARRLGMPSIDILACNFYELDLHDTHDTAGKATSRTADAFEVIDVGGPALVRAAAKNFASVLPVVDPADYGTVLDALAGAGGDVTAIDPGFRRALAAKAFARTAAYDLSIARALQETHH